LVFAAALSPQDLSGRASSITAQELRCEYQESPLAIQSDSPRFSWKLKASDPAMRGLSQSAYRILVSSSATLAAQGKGDYWDSGTVSSDSTIQIPYGGKPLPSFAHLYWSVRVWDQAGSSSARSQTSEFHMGILSPNDWRAKWIAREDTHSRSLPIFRREFAISKPVAEAIAYVSGLGQYELRINGQKADNAVLTPGWTDYRKTVFYNAYDLTKALHQGSNAVGILLGNGMYNVEASPGRYTKFVGSFGPPKLIFQAKIVFTDGSSAMVVSDSSWRCHDGPIMFSSPFGGEDYDARLEPDGWLQSGFNDRGWSNAAEVSGPGGTLVAQQSPAIKVEHVYAAKHVTEPKPGVHVYDLGQNFSGWPELSVQGAAGSSVKLIPGELLDAGGFVSQVSSGKPQWFSYTLRGSGTEVWHPRFSYYGFRYVQLETAASNDGFPQQPRLEAVQGQFIHADVPVVGQFRCSDELLNRIHRLIDAAILSNTQSVLTDCPHREKLGWLEETHLLASSLMYNYGLARLYEKISDDMRDAQAPSGLMPEIAPEYTKFPPPFNDSPEWGSAVVLTPWISYQHYANVRDLADHYPQMKRYTDYLGTRAKNGIVSYGLGDWYDIGPGEPGFSKLTSLGLTATAIYYTDLSTVSQAAKRLGKTDDAEALAHTAEQVREAFNRAFYHPDTHVYDRGSQTAYAMPLTLGIVPQQDRQLVLQKLIDNIREHQNHVTAGDIGFHFVVEALLEGDRSDVLYDMLSRTDPPSYGYQLHRGATTLTEAWDANPRSSQNHFMLGHVEEWFYRRLAGINIDLSQPHENQIVIRPWLVGGIKGAEASYDSAVGRIAVSWKHEQNLTAVDLAIPPNTVATVYLAKARRAPVYESGHPVHEVREVIVLRENDTQMECRVASGRYHFTMPQLPD
jgi:alpha-L-rhamnosidase